MGRHYGGGLNVFNQECKSREEAENVERKRGEMAQLRIQDADAYIQQQAPVSAIAGEVWAYSGELQISVDKLCREC